MSTSQEHAQAAVLELVRRIVEALVDTPERVSIVPVMGERSTVIEISAQPPEVGQIIGRGGRNIHSLQAIVQAVGAKHGLDCQVFVLDKPRDASEG
ncbi:MAG: KH domain-containing protein [Candidatus Eisenbacteria bacterium]